MNRPKIAALVLALSTTSVWSYADPQSEPAPAPPKPATRWQQPLHQQATAESLAAFRTGENETAITKANECIARFADAANRIQDILAEQKATLPTGKVSEADKRSIARYQILHDVATCFLIKAWAEEKLGHKDAARKAYVEAGKYTFARMKEGTEDLFTSPAEIASERLSHLK